MYPVATIKTKIIASKSIAKPPDLGARLNRLPLFDSTVSIISQNNMKYNEKRRLESRRFSLHTWGVGYLNPEKKKEKKRNRNI